MVMKQQAAEGAFAVQDLGPKGAAAELFPFSCRRRSSSSSSSQQQQEKEEDFRIDSSSTRRTKSK